MKKIITTLILLFISQVMHGQYQMGLVPRESPDRAVHQKIAYTTVKVEYGSPAVKNRKVWGDLVPYGKVWRAGANNATTVEFSSGVSVNDMPLDSGKYALFVIPNEKDTWTIIFNNVHNQWGAFKYNQDEDALRLAVNPRISSRHTENLTYSIEQKGYKFGSIILKWDSMELEIPFETNYLRQFEQQVESRAKKQPGYLQWIVYLQGAEHLLQIGSNEDVAISWINQAEKIMDSHPEWNEQFYPRDYVKGHLYWTKARLLAQKEDFEEALSYARKVKTLANLIYYTRKNEAESIDVLVKQWKGQ